MEAARQTGSTPGAPTGTWRTISVTHFMDRIIIIVNTRTHSLTHTFTLTHTHTHKRTTTKMMIRENGSLAKDSRRSSVVASLFYVVGFFLLLTNESRATYLRSTNGKGDSGVVPEQEIARWFPENSIASIYQTEPHGGGLPPQSIVYKSRESPIIASLENVNKRNLMQAYNSASAMLPVNAPSQLLRDSFFNPMARTFTPFPSAHIVTPPGSFQMTRDVQLYPDMVPGLVGTATTPVMM